MSAMTKEVVALTYEFIITLVVLMGSGFLVYSDKAVEVAVSAITAVITFWFSRRQQEKAIEKQKGEK